MEKFFLLMLSLSFHYHPIHTTLTPTFRDDSMTFSYLHIIYQTHTKRECL